MPKTVARKSDERLAGLRARTELIIRYYGGVHKMAEFLEVQPVRIYAWKRKGFISAIGAEMIHEQSMRLGRGFQAQWVRPDLRWKNGKLNSPRTYGNDYHELL